MDKCPRSGHHIGPHILILTTLLLDDMDLSEGFPDDALNDLAYLSRSKNRLQILRTLSKEALTRGELEDLTAISRTTVDRVVNELEERKWITRSPGGEYGTTPVGERIVTESTRFIGAIQAIRNLGDAVEWLPREELRIGLQHFRKATVRRPEPNAMNAPDTFATELMWEATRFACLVNTPPSLAFEEAMVDGVLDGRLTTKHVITEGELGILRQDADRASRWQQYIQAGANLYCYHGQIPCNVLVIDETVLLLDREPEAAEGIESTNQEARSWALELINEYQDKAERLDTAAFS